MTKSPVRPPLALTIGVIGHRPNRIPEAARPKIDADIAAVLAAVKAAAEAATAAHAEVFAAEPARPVLLSALAEGADRYAALAALDAGIALSVALPFPVEEYAKDFAEQASRDEYAAADRGGRAGDDPPRPARLRPRAPMTASAWSSSRMPT